MTLNNKLTKILLLCIISFSFALTSCEYEVITPAVIELPPVDEKISFSETIAPIMTDKCASCHASRNPVLTEGNIYNSLTNGSYIDLINPANSSIYIKIEAGHPSGNSTSPTENALILRWITEGALDN